MSRKLTLATFAAVAAALAPLSARSGERVDVELVLAVDVSGSVSRGEQELQRTGLAMAFRDREVIDAIRALPRGLAVAVVGFAGARQTRTVVSWRHVSDAATIAALADRIASAFPIAFDHCGMTAIGDALAWSQKELATNAYEGRAKIDVSGDGSNSEGEDPKTARDRALAAGITINGLVILNEETYLEEYYRKKVIGGPGAFVMTAVDFTSFAEAIRLKLLREIAPTPSADRQRWGASPAPRGV